LVYAYLQCTTGVVNLEEYVGAYVGVLGTPTYDENSRTYVVEVEHIVVLPESTTRPGATGKPAPTTRPAGAVGGSHSAESPGKKPAAVPHPPTGLPVVEPTTRPSSPLGVNAAEYD